MRAPYRLVLSALAAGVVGLVLADLGDAALSRGRIVPTAAARSRLRARGAASGAETRVAPRQPQGTPAPVGGWLRAEAPRLDARAPRAAAALPPVATEDHLATPANGSAPGPRVALEPLVATPGHVSAALRGDDPGAPRRLVLWRLLDGRAARAAEGESRADRSLAFPEVVLAGRGELFVTGANVPVELAARLPGDRVSVPAPVDGSAGNDLAQRSAEQEETR